MYGTDCRNISCICLYPSYTCRKHTSYMCRKISQIAGILPTCAGRFQKIAGILPTCAGNMFPTHAGRFHRLQEYFLHISNLFLHVQEACFLHFGKCRKIFTEVVPYSLISTLTFKKTFLIYLRECSTTLS